MLKPQQAATTVLLGALIAVSPLAMDIYLASMPSMTRSLAATPQQVQLTLSLYMYAWGASQLVTGPLSDRFGRRPLLLAGLAVFTAASAACAAAPTIDALIAARVVQALAMGTVAVVPRAVVRDYFDGRELVRMLSMLVLVMMLGPILAPSVGGQLLVRFGWRSVFFLLAGYGVVLLVLAGWLLPESLRPEQRRRESIAAIAATYGRILRDRDYLGQVLSGGLVFSGLLAYISGSSFVFIELFHVSPQRFGLYFGSNAIGLMAASQVNRYLASRMAPEAIVRAALPVAVVSGLTLLVNAITGFGGFAGILVPLFCFIACHGFTMPNTTALAMSPYGAVAGSASALMGTLQFLLGAASGSLVSAFGNGTAVPFAAVIAGCGLAAFLVHSTMARHRFS
jgi:DHA1 family bicyclomycin/chloramphenicol resistance-like MFS transporter